MRLFSFTFVHLLCNFILVFFFSFTIHQIQPLLRQRNDSSCYVHICVLCIERCQKSLRPVTPKFINKSGIHKIGVFHVETTNNCNIWMRNYVLMLFTFPLERIQSHASLKFNSSNFFFILWKVFFKNGTSLCKTRCKPSALKHSFAHEVNLISNANIGHKFSFVY